MVQWLRICLAIGRTQVRSLVWEGPTCLRVIKLMFHNYWACTLETCSATREATTRRSPHTIREWTLLSTARESPHTAMDSWHRQKQKQIFFFLMILYTSSLVNPSFVILIHKPR